MVSAGRVVDANAEDSRRSTAELVEEYSRIVAGPLKAESDRRLLQIFAELRGRSPLADGRRLLELPHLRARRRPG